MTLKTLFALLMLLMMATIGSAQTITSTQNGDWNLGTTWVGGVAPTATNDVIIQHAVDLAQNETINDVTIQSGGTLNVYDSGNDWILTINGDLDVNSGGNWTNLGDVSFNGTGNQNIDFNGNGSFGDFTVNKSNTLIINTNFDIQTSFTLTSGSVTLSSGNVISFYGSGSGNFDINGGGFTSSSTGQIYFDNSCTVTSNIGGIDFPGLQIIRNAFLTLTLSGGTFNILGDVERGGRHSLSGTISYDGSDLIYSPNGTMIVDANADEWPGTSGPSAVRINAGTISLEQSRTIEDLTIDGGSLIIGGTTGALTTTGTSTLRNNALTVNSGRSLTINGTLDLNGGALAVDGTLNYGGSETVRYSASSTQYTGDAWPTGVSINNVSITNADVRISDDSSSVASTSRNAGSLSLTAAGGELRHGGVLNITGDVSASTGSYGTTDGGTLNVTGGSNQIVASGALTMDNLTMLSTDGQLNGITVNNALTISNTSGSVRLTGTVTLANSCTLSVSTANSVLNLNNQTLNVGVTGTRLAVTGTLQTGGTSIDGFETYDLSGTVVYTGAGSASETIPNLNFTNLTINNTSTNGVNVANGASPTVSGALNLTTGLLHTSSSATMTILSGASVSGDADSYVHGPLSIADAAGSSITFPVGKDSYRPVTTNLTSGGTPTITFEVFDQVPNQNWDTGTIDHISLVRYWLGQTTAGITGGTVTLQYGPDDGVSTPSTLQIVRSTNNGSNQYSLVGTGGVGSPGGSIVSDDLGNIGTPLGYFTLGDEQGDNSLPISLSSFQAEPITMGGIMLNWITESELQNEGFNIFRRQKDESVEWQLLTFSMIPGQGNTAEKTTYEYIDRSAQAGVTYEYMLESVSYAGVRVQEKVIEVAVPMPTEYATLGNYPNPFNPTTQIGFRLPETSDVSILIYGIQGNLVRELALNQSFEAGDHFMTWDATDNKGQPVASGMYVYLFTAGKYNKTEKMLLLK